MIRKLLLTLLLGAVGLFAIIFIKDTQLADIAVNEFRHIPIKINTLDNSANNLDDDNTTEMLDEELESVLPQEETLVGDDSGTALNDEVKSIESELDDLSDLDELETSLDI